MASATGGVRGRRRVRGIGIRGGQGWLGGGGWWEMLAGAAGEVGGGIGLV